LAEAAAAVVLNGRTEKTVDTAVARLKPLPQPLRGIAADLESSEGCAAFV
jgi:hypothetical protein